MNKWGSHSGATSPLPKGDLRAGDTTAEVGRPACASSTEPVLEAVDHSAQTWRSTLVVLAFGLVALIVLFGGTATQIAQVWWGNDAYNHGIFIVPISIFLVWRSRHRLSRISPKPSYLGVAVMAIAAIGWLLGNVAGVLVVEQFSFALMLQAFVLSVVGWKVFRAALFPIFFLVFAIPFGEFLIPPLQDFTASFTVRALQLSGIPVFLEGLYIQIPAATFEVAAACSGSRFLITSVTLGSLVANQFYQQTWRRVLFLTLSILVPIIANGFRAYGLVMIAHLSDLQLAVGADHVTFGLIFLSFVIVLLLLAGSLFREKRGAVGPTPTKTGGSLAVAMTVPRLPKLVGIAVGTILVAGTAAAYAPVIENRGIEQAASVDLTAPVVGTDWRRVADTKSGWRPKFYGATDEKLWFYAKEGKEIEVYAAFYPYQRQDFEVVGWRNRLAGEKIWQQLTTVNRAEVELEGKTQEVLRTHLRSVNGQRVVLYWYWIDGRFEADPRVAKLRQIKTQLLGEDQSAAVIAVATNYSESPDEAMGRLRSFLAGSPSFESVIMGAQPTRKLGSASSSSTACQGDEPCAE